MCIIWGVEVKKICVYISSFSFKYSLDQQVPLELHKLQLVLRLWNGTVDQTIVSHGGGVKKAER